jgi:penicillin amidase
MKIVRRILTVIGTLLLVLILAVGGWLVYAIRAPMPSVAGTFQVSGLKSTVQVYRDHLGIPQIYADNPHDLFFAQGYVHAQDRFTQMEFARRFASGRLSEVFGALTLEVDRFVRILGWPRVVKEEVASLDDNTRSILQAYADGVNAYVSSHSHLGLELELMGALGMKDTPEPWSIADTVGWLKIMSMNMNSNMNSEIRNAQLIQKVGEKAIGELWPTTLPGSPVITTPGTNYTASNTTALTNFQKGMDYADLNLATLKAYLDAVQSTQLAHIGTGSNSWALSGKLTDTGKPYLANDPHLGIQMPSIWYEVGLHCNTLSADCPYDVTGVSFTGMPGVIIGHNQRIAWGFTNLFADVQDLYIERINPNNPDQYEVDGQWKDMDIVTETIRVRGQISSTPPTEDSNPALSGAYDAATGFTEVKMPVRLTRHGPVIDDYNSQVRKFNGVIGSTQVPDRHVTALRWTALEPTTAVRMVYELDRARNWDEFRQAMRDFDTPAQSVTYADVDGNIGFQAPGKIPIRAKGNGQFPVPGWNSEYEWQGYIPFEKLPYVYNPPEGYIVAANNAAAGPDYPYLISMEWNPGVRAGRIVEMIKAHAGKPITHDDIAQMQKDLLNLSARKMMPHLAALHFDDPETQAALNDLTAWDCQQKVDSGPAALYAVLWAEILKTAFDGKLPQQQWPLEEAVIQLMADPANAWWDDKSTPNVVEQRDDVLRRAFTSAVADAKTLMGANRKDWALGKLQQATFSNSALGSIPVIGGLFNRGPFPVSGWSNSVTSVVWVTGNDLNPSDPVTYKVFTMPSMRAIVDLSNLANSSIIYNPGQSGHPYNQHYDDLVEPWLQGKSYPQLWERPTIEAAAESHMTLTP